MMPVEYCTFPTIDYRPRLKDVAEEMYAERGGASVDIVAPLRNAIEQLLEKVPTDWTSIREIIPSIRRWDQPALPHSLPFYLPAAGRSKTVAKERVKPATPSS